MFLGELFDHLPTMFLPDRKQVVDVEFSQSIPQWSARTTNPAFEKTTWLSRKALGRSDDGATRSLAASLGAAVRRLILALPAIANA